MLAAVVVTTALAAALGFEKNEQVRLDQIEADRVRELVAEFNNAILEQRLLEEARTTGNTLLDQQHSDLSEQCVRCHDLRSAKRFTSGVDRTAASDYERKALALHQMAGLIDTRIEEIKHHISEIRTQLRGFRLQRAADGGG